MNVRNNTTGNGHNSIIAQIVALFDKIGDGCRKLLRNLKYVVPDEFDRGTRWRWKLLCAWVLPLAALAFALIFFTIEPLYFFAILISVLYKALTTQCEYNNYVHSGTGQGTSGLKPENPLLIRLIVIVVALIFLFVSVLAHIFWIDEVSMRAVVIVCGWLDILITCGLDILDALAILFQAEPPNFN